MESMYWYVLIKSTYSKYFILVSLCGGIFGFDEVDYRKFHWGYDQGVSLIYFGGFFFVGLQLCMHFVANDEEETSYMTQLLKNPMHAQEEGGERPTLANNREDSFVRRSTFSRTLTFSPETYHRAVVQPLEGLQRTFTELGNRIDPDAQYTNALIDQYQKHSEGNEGDLPLQTGFARKAKFWKVVLLLTVVASFMGLVAAGFMNCTEEVPKQYVTCDYGDSDKNCGNWYSGEKYWIAISGGSGLLVGLIRYFTSYPHNLPGLFKDIHDFHVHPDWAPVTFLISAISLSGGATLGPEQALGNVGGGLATYLTEVLDPGWFDDDDYKALLVLGGMTAPLGALFQAPLLGALMIHELGEPPKSFMESTTMLAIAAMVCFVVYYEMVTSSYIEHVSSKGIILSLEWNKSKGYQDWMVGTGFIIGVVSGCLCFMCVLTIGVTKQIFNRIRSRVANPFLKEVLPPLIGGLVIGTVNWALPGTVGNGNLTNNWVIKKGGMEGDLDDNLLLCTGFARMALLGVSMNCGFVGGIVFPFLSMGIIAGVVAHQHYQEVPLGLFISAFMVALPCGIVPMPFTFTCLSAFAFFLGLNQTVPIFVAVITSFSLVCSSGLMKGIVRRSEAREAAEAAAAANKENPMAAVEKAKKEADEFALNHYLGNQKKQAASSAV